MKYMHKACKKDMSMYNCQRNTCVESEKRNQVCKEQK